MASSGSAAQFMKAFTLMVWSVYGSLIFTKASAVRKCKFLYFFDLCV